jgi:hypothetical protein
MTNRSPFPAQLRLQFLCECPVLLEGATRKEIVQLLAQILAHAVVDAAVPTDPEVRDERR